MTSIVEFHVEENGIVCVTFDNGTEYKGTWIDETINVETEISPEYKIFWPNTARGVGTMTYSNNNVYVGSWKGLCRHGKGTFNYSDGSIYVGKFKDGSYNGKGVYTYSDGSIYVGKFKNYVMHGKGTFTEANCVCVGKWYNNHLQGEGTRINADGTYTGGWHSGFRNGKGTFTNSDGKYVGKWYQMTKFNKINNFRYKSSFLWNFFYYLHYIEGSSDYTMHLSYNLTTSDIIVYIIFYIEGSSDVTTYLL